MLWGNGEKDGRMGTPEGKGVGERVEGLAAVIGWMGGVVGGQRGV